MPALFVLVLSLNLLSVVFGDLPKGAEFLGKGIDVVTGNLKPTSVQEVDDTFGFPNIYTPKVESDVEVINLNSGEFSISVSELETISEVTSEYSTTVSVSGSFKASASN